jgi:acetate kinase
MRNLLTSDDPHAADAIDLFVYRIGRELGSLAAALGGLDALVFTGGIGENSASMRRRICDGLAFMGLQLDLDRNTAPDLSDRAAPQIQAYGSRVRVFVTETAEQLMIARETVEALARTLPAVETIPVAVSGRHVHLSRKAIDALFGKGYELTPAKPLRQPGHWAARERVALEGPKGILEQVAILGPLRTRTQAEVSRTDSFVLGINVPLRESSKLDGTPWVTVIGPAGTFTSDGLIVAARHIHTNPYDAARLGLEDRELIDVHVSGGPRGLTFAQTRVRVGEASFTEMHIDTDEANAAGIDAYADGEIVAGHAATIRT